MPRRSLSASARRDRIRADSGGQVAESPPHPLAFVLS